MGTGGAAVPQYHTRAAPADKEKPFCDLKELDKNEPWQYSTQFSNQVFKAVIVQTHHPELHAR